MVSFKSLVLREVSLTATSKTMAVCSESGFPRWGLNQSWNTVIIRNITTNSINIAIPGLTWSYIFMSIYISFSNFFNDWASSLILQDLVFTIGGSSVKAVFARGTCICSALEGARNYGTIYSIITVWETIHTHDDSWKLISRAILNIAYRSFQSGFKKQLNKACKRWRRLQDKSLLYMIYMIAIPESASRNGSR